MERRQNNNVLVRLQSEALHICTSQKIWRCLLQFRSHTAPGLLLRGMDSLKSILAKRLNKRSTEKISIRNICGSSTLSPAGTAYGTQNDRFRAGTRGNSEEKPANEMRTTITRETLALCSELKQALRRHVKTLPAVFSFPSA